MIRIVLDARFLATAEFCENVQLVAVSVPSTSTAPPWWCGHCKVVGSLLLIDDCVQVPTTRGSICSSWNMPTWVSSGLCGSTRAKRYCDRYTVTARVHMRLWRSDSCATHPLNRRGASSNAADARARAPPPPPYRVPAAAVARAMMVVRVTRHSRQADP